MERLRIMLQSWGLKSLIPIGLFGLVWFSSREPDEEPARMRMTQGKPGVRTLGFALSPDGKTVATTDNVGQVALHDIKSGRGLPRILDSQQHVAWGVAFSPSGRVLAVGSVGPELRLFDLVSGGARRLQNTSFRQTRALAFSPDGRTLAVATQRNGDVFLWDITTDRVRTTVHGRYPALCLAFSPDGRTLAVGGRGERTVSLWDLETGLRQLLSWETSGAVSSVAFSPDGSLLAAASPVQREVPIWEPRTGHLCRQIAGHVGGTNAVSFSPDGATLVTAGNDGMVRLWRVATGAQRTRLDGQSSWLPQVVFSADGRTLVACGGDNHIRIWDMDEIFRTKPNPAED